MIDPLTAAGIAGLICVVLGACFAIYKVLSKETTFEEAFPNAAVKQLLTKDSANNEKTNKAAKKRHQQKHPQRKNTPHPQHQNKAGGSSNSVGDDNSEPAQSSVHEHEDQEEVLVVPESPANEQQPAEEMNTIDHDEPVQSEEKIKPKKAEVKKKESSIGKQAAEKATSPKRKFKASNNQQPQSLEEEFKQLEQTEQREETTTNLLGASAEPANRDNSEGLAEESVLAAGPSAEQPQQVVKKGSRKPVSIKELNMAKVVDRLQELAELEPEYLNFLTTTAEEQRAKEDKLRGEVKDTKAVNSELERKLKAKADELEHMRKENVQLVESKKHQQQNFGTYEQMVKQKLVETVQLKEENKKLLDALAQMHAKVAESEQLKQTMGVYQAELHKAKAYVEQLVGEQRSGHASFQAQAQAVQGELNKEREQRQKVEHECGMATQMMEKLVTEMASKDNSLREFDQFKAAYEAKVQALQNELNCEKDAHTAWKQAVSSADEQLTGVGRELETAKSALQALKAQDAVNTAKAQQVAAANRDLEAQLGRMEAEAKQHGQQETSQLEELKASLAALNTKLEDQRERNQDLRDANFKLLEQVKQQGQKHQKSEPLVVLNGGEAEAATTMNGNGGKQQQEQIERLQAENKQYKHSLDSVRKQLAEASRIAEEMEREKDEKLALIEAKLTNLLEQKETET